MRYIFSWSFWLISKIYIIFSEIMYKNCIPLTYKRICILCWTILLLHPLLCMEMWEWKFDMSGLISLQFSADGYSTYIWLSTYIPYKNVKYIPFKVGLQGCTMLGAFVYWITSSCGSRLYTTFKARVIFQCLPFYLKLVLYP